MSISQLRKFTPGRANGNLIHPHVRRIFERKPPRRAGSCFFVFEVIVNKPSTNRV